MRRVVRIASQVIDFARRLAPEPRRAVKRALRGLRDEKGDIRALDASLSGYYRLRVGRYRVVFGYAADGSIDAVYIEERSIVYEVFENEFIKRLRGRRAVGSALRCGKG